MSPLRWIPRPSLMVGVAGFLGCSLFAGCTAQDVDALNAERSAELIVGPYAEGEFDMRIADMLDGSGSRVSYHLVNGPEEIELELPEGMELPRNAVIRTFGDIYNGVMDVDHFDVVEPAPVHAIDPDRRDPRRIATILVFWGETPGLNNGTARESMFLGNRSTNVFYGENSYGKEMIAGNVFGPYQIDDPGGCNTSLITDSALRAFRERGHEEANYSQFMFQFAGVSCGWSGLASVGSPDAPARNSWYNGSFGCVVRNQEIAHNYGLSHARTYTCEGESGNDCLPPFSLPSNYPNNLEYGHPYDPMGRGCGHMNVIHKTRMSWLEGCNVVTTRQNGRFNLLPTELPCNGTQALRFPTTDGRYYWLEYRQRLGSFDAALGTEGVLVHVGTEQATSPYLVRVDNDSLIRAGESWTDPSGNVTFTVSEENPSHAVIDVTFADGGDASSTPTCLDNSAPLEEAGGIGSLECAEEPFPRDTELPSVAITYPNDGDYFEVGADFTITAEGVDDRNITELQLYIDGEPVQSQFTNPGEWGVNNIPRGVYELGVVAWDGPNYAPSEAIDIYVGVEPPSAEADSSGGCPDEDDCPPDDDTSTEPEDGGDSTGSDDGGTTSGGDASQDGASDDSGCSVQSRRTLPAWSLVLLALGAGLRRSTRRRR